MTNVSKIYKFVNNEPGLVITFDKKRYLVISDIHLGLTYHLEYKGVNVPNQTEDVLDYIVKLKKKTRVHSLIIVGDLKHALPGTPHDERKDVREFLESLKKEFKELILVKGNHDTLIEEIVPWLHVEPYLLLGKVLFVHGHRNLPKDVEYDTVVIGHNHPVIKFKDRMGGVYYQRCWLISNSLIVMPGFNVLSGGKAVNDGFSFLGPIAKTIDPEKIKAVLLDGTDLGILKDLEIKRD
ncbi:hypothetical protein CL614_03845 [archaeon]|nr:hypothetical protein [archaeon]